MTSLHPNLVLCAQPETARFWEELELGRGVTSAWRETTGWIGLAPSAAVLPTENTCGSFDSPESCRTFLRALINAERSRSLHDRGIALQADYLKTLVILEADETGLTPPSQGLAETALRVATPRTEHDLQTIILLLQYGSFAPAVKEPLEKLRSAFLSKRYGAQFAPKIVVACDSDDQRTWCKAPHLQQFAAVFAHFLLPQNDWSFFSGTAQEPGQVAAIGLRSVFWDRQRAIELCRRQHFVNFAGAWIDGTGFLPVDRLPPAPTRWPSNPTDWKDLVWRRLQGIWQRETLQTETGSVDDRLQILIHDIQQTIELRLRTDVEKNIHDVRRREKGLNLNMNLVSLIVQQQLTAPLGRLGEAIEEARAQTRTDLVDELRAFRQQGGGLTILRNWLADAGKRVRKTCGENLQRESEESRFDSCDMLTTARLYVDELMRIPDMKSLLGSCWILFIFITTTLVGMGLSMWPTRPRAVFLLGMLGAALVSLVIGWFGYWFYSTRAAKRLADFLEVTQKMVSSLAHHRIQLAASELVVADADELSRQIQAQENAMGAARNALAVVFAELPPPGDRPPFLCQIDPLQTPLAGDWQQAIDQASQNWAAQIWARADLRDFPDNWMDFMKSLAALHLDDILNSTAVFHLDHPVARRELKDLVWQACVPLPLQARPSEAFTERGDRQQILLFTPGPWQDHLDTSLKNKFPDNDFLMSRILSENPDAIAFVRLRDNLPWKAFIRE
jgi:hypothetical protein